MHDAMPRDALASVMVHESQRIGAAWTPNRSANRHQCASISSTIWSLFKLDG